MFDNSEAVLEINDILNEMGGYTMNAADFASSMETMRRSSKVGGRGRGIAPPLTRDSLEEVRLAAHLNRLQPHNFPMGHLPTTEETLLRTSDTEITAGLRAMGISGADSVLRSNRTRPTVAGSEDIHVDRNVPVILNGDLFHRRYQAKPQGESPSAPWLEPYDPAIPLAEQFPTITEFQQCEEPSEENSHQKKQSKPKADQHCKKSKTSPSGKGKKTKWRKVSNEELTKPTHPRGRYDVDDIMGPGTPGTPLFRTVEGETGRKFLV